MAVPRGNHHFLKKHCLSDVILFLEPPTGNSVESSQLGADVVEIYSAETGEELDDRIPEEKLNNREVVEYRRTSGFLSIVLKS